MESLLVYSDGESAVVLVINADHSPLGKWRKRQSESGTRHFPLSIPVLMSSTCPSSLQLALICKLTFTAAHSLPFKTLHFFFPYLFLTFIVFLTRIQDQPFGT